MDTIAPFHHCTISPSQGDIANAKSVNSIISPSQGEIKNVTSVNSTMSPSQEGHFTVTRRYCKRDKLEANFFGHAGRNDKWI